MALNGENKMNENEIITALCNLGYHAWETRSVIKEGEPTKASVLRCKHCYSSIPKGKTLNWNDAFLKDFDE